KTARRRGDQPHPAPMQGRPPTARASLKGRPAALTRGGSCPQGQQPPASTASCGQPTRAAFACSAVFGRGCRPWSALPLAGRRRQSQGWPPLGRAAASGQGQPPPA
ncbi:hypothetical protein GW17_00056474, partial [Ensete ventricosum]